MKEEWLQINVALVHSAEAGALPSARALFDALAPVIAEARKSKRLQLFFFQRKAPDVRLRLLTRVSKRRFERPLSAIEKSKAIKRFFFSIYEPETRQFGGPDAMALVHAYFDADTRAWLKHDGLLRRGRQLASAEAIVSAAAEDLFTRTLGDRSEIWDAWCNLCELVPKVDVAPESLLLTLDELEQPVLMRAGARLADGLRRLWERGSLTAGLRAILPFVVWFQLNRWGVRPELQCALARARANASNPKAGLRGSSA